MNSCVLDDMFVAFDCYELHQSPELMAGHETILAEQPQNVVVPATEAGQDQQAVLSSFAPFGIPGEHGMSNCAGCGQAILERYYLFSADRSWHLQCLRCCVCNRSLEEEHSCFCRNGYIYCRSDYYRQFSSICAKCQKMVFSKDLIMRAKSFVYHLGCFSCNVCDVSLNPGQYFAVNSLCGTLFCQAHYEPMLFGSVDSENYYQDDDNHVLLTGNCNSASQTKVGRPKKRKSSTSLDQSEGVGSNLVLGGPSDINGFHIGHSRSKRMRTSFKHSQLKAMKAYFALNHNPDAKDLKQLAQRTGLTKRVLQVWFQNARAKYRRSVQQQNGANSEGGTGDDNGEERSLSKGGVEKAESDMGRDGSEGGILNEDLEDGLSDSPQDGLGYQSDNSMTAMSDPLSHQSIPDAHDIPAGSFLHIQGPESSTAVFVSSENSHPVPFLSMNIGGVIQQSFSPSTQLLHPSRQENEPRERSPTSTLLPFISVYDEQSTF